MSPNPKLRRDALRIFNAGLDAADPRKAVLKHVRVEGDVLRAGGKKYRLGRGRIFVVGAGKASAAMAQGVEELLGPAIEQGLINVKYGHTEKLRRIKLNECGHPYPDAAGVAGSEAIVNLLSNTQEGDLVICLVSGGASALLPLPISPITLESKQACTKLLLASGASIGEVNAVRKHISGIKGGQLAALAMPARVLSLILSDVIGNDLDVIGSGITAPDTSTFSRAIEVLDRYALLDKIAPEIRNHLERGSAGEIPETPKPDHPAFQNTQNLIVGSAEQAVEACALKSKELGYKTMVLSSSIEGETRDVARVHAAIAREIVNYRRPLRAPACVISGGETTVTLRGSGKGGRNQEFALAAGLDLKGLPEVLVMSAGTDGTDGPTDAAGAFADGTTVERGSAAGVEAVRYLQENNSYVFLDTIGDLIRTGPTKTNVMDIRLVLVR